MYEIPNQLIYKERIIFNLTFEQLAYAFIFLPIILLIFKLNIYLEIKVFLSLFPIILAVAFIFFDLFEHLKKWYTWFRHRELRNDKIDSFFEIKKIDNDLIYTKNKKLAVLSVDSLNFDLKPKNEKEMITLAFQKFLNSLDFPIQILMTTENIELGEYLKSLEGRTTKDSKEIFTEYKKHLEKIIDKNNVSNRNFFIIIPEITDISIQLKICQDRLSGINLKNFRLGNNQLKNLIMTMFNEKKSLYPKLIKNNPEFLEINNTFYRTIYAHGYPRMVESGFLDRIVSSLGDFNLSLHIEPITLEDTFILLNKELQKQRADLYSAKLKNQLNSSLEIQYSDTVKTLENLQKGNEKLYNISLYVTCRADSKKELDLLTKKVESELNSLMIIPKQPNFRMLQGLKSCMPLLENTLQTNRNITTKALSTFFPFTSSFFKFDETGIWFGLNKNKIPIIRDIFKLSNANGICLASSGSGKSYTAKLFLSRHLLNGTKVIVIDPQGEYKDIVEKFNGQVIDLSRNSETIINPLDLMGHKYPEKRLTLMDLLPIMIGDITEPQKPFIDKALTVAYESKGIYMDEEDSWDNEPPILEDVLEALKKFEKSCSTLEKTTLRSLINRLSIYVDGVFSFLNRHTQIDFNNKFICLDIGNLPKQIKPSIMFLLLDYVYTKMKDDLERKLLVIDEAWSLLSKSNEASYIFEIVKTCRKHNLSLLLINQEVEDMLNSKAGRSVLANSSYTLLLKQKPAVIDSIQKVFNLSDSERVSLLTALVGEGILIMEDEHNHIKIVASSEEHKLITTNADELLSRGKKVRNVGIQKNKTIMKKIKINVDINKRFFRKSELNKEEIKHLLKKGYKISKHKSLRLNRIEEFLLKPRHNESLNHLFTTYDISYYLESKGIETKMFVTQKPDIVFNLRNKKYAIEVETGIVLEKNVSQLKNKIKLLNDNYDKWFFVLTNRNKVKKYKKYGKCLDMRYLKRELLNLVKKRK